MSGTADLACLERWTSGVCSLFRLSDGRYFLDETYLARRHVLTPEQGAQIAGLMRLDPDYRSERFDDVVAAYASAAGVAPGQMLVSIASPYLVHLNTDGKAMVITATSPPPEAASTDTAHAPNAMARQFGEEIANICQVIDAYAAKNLPLPRSSARRLREVATAIGASGGTATMMEALNEANRIYKRSGLLFTRYHTETAAESLVR
jgi:hypothetical protein